MSTISEIASNKEIVTITSDTGKSAYDVAVLMKNKKVGSVIVMAKKITGIITSGHGQTFCVGLRGRIIGKRTENKKKKLCLLYLGFGSECNR